MSGMHLATKFQSYGTAFMKFRPTLKFRLHRDLKMDQRCKSRTPCIMSGMHLAMM